jgi:hypothetical protein
MSQETSVDQVELVVNMESNIIVYSTRLIERTIERALGLYLYYTLFHYWK